MKIYFHLNIGGFSNCYIVINEETHHALIIDPGRITTALIDQIEGGGNSLSGVLITHNHGSHVQGIKTILKIYEPKIFAADWEVSGHKTTVITGDGTFQSAGLTVSYCTVPGHTADSMVYKIGNVLFTGDVLGAGTIGSTTNRYSERLLRAHITKKIFSQTDDTIIMPGHGPPTSVGIEKYYNSAFKKK
ncbi:MAG: MBL fold metallo-hydrolase [Treponema sp.]|nr:MBL fold metallo-hydrolase [Treponema sp.]